MQARSNTLKLKWRSWGLDEEKRCPLGCSEDETLEHFLIRCDKLQHIRIPYLELQRPNRENVDSLIKEILLLNHNNKIKTEKYVDLIKNLWAMRNLLMGQ